MYRYNFENVEIKKLFGKTLWVELLDYDELTGEQKRGTIIIPNQDDTGNSDFYRIGRVLNCADDCDESLKGDNVLLLLPPKAGIVGVKKMGKRPTIFIREDLVMAVIDVKSAE
jgi:hypothetical protein